MRCGDTAEVEVSRTGRRGLGAGLLVAGIIALGLNLRAAITSLPPLFPELAVTLHVSVAAQAVLAAVPVICFGVFSGFAAPLSRRFGEERVLGSAVLLLAVGLLLRAAAPRLLLFEGTVIAGGAIALLNVLMPSLIKRRRPEQAGLLIGFYLLSLAAGAIVGALLAVPVFTAAGGNGAAVRLSLGLWALPALAAAVIWLPQLRYRTLPDPVPPDDAAAGRAAADDAAAGRAAADDAAAGRAAADDAAAGQAVPGRPRRPGVLALGRYLLTWELTAFMGLQSLIYYATLSWFPTMFRDRGVSAVHAGDLLALMNLGNAVTAMLLPVLAHRARDQRMLVAVSVLVTGAGLVGAAFGPLASAAPLIFVLGLGQGATLGLSIFLFTARAPDPATSASLSSFGQGGGYLLASTGPLFIGFLHSVTGGWAVPVWTLLGIAVLALVTGWLAGRDRTVPGPGAAAPRTASRPASRPAA